MTSNLEQGLYVIAVSGGVDSMVLLDLLSKQPDVDLVIAHFDHGIREDSSEDRKIVEDAAKKYGFVFEYTEGNLGPATSEEKARTARYTFLEALQEKHKARAIVTAHHQDDLIETALINLLRGTGRKGLTALSSNQSVLRPLLSYTKQDVLNYAKTNQLYWREDSTNQQTDYLRNYVRIKVIPKLSKTNREKLIKELSALNETNKEIDSEISDYLGLNNGDRTSIDKKLISNLDHVSSSEVMAEWLRQNNIRDFDKKTIERLIVAAKTFKPGQRVDINKQKYLYIDKNTLVIT